MEDKNNAPDRGGPDDAPPVLEDQDAGVITQQQPPALSLDDYRRLLDRLDALEREKAERQRADAYAAGEVFVHPNTHMLVLANGDTIETANPSVTHVHDGETDTVVPVIGRYELKPAS